MKLFLFIISMTLSVITHAQSTTIYVLHMSAPGGLIEMQNRAIAEKIESNGMRTEFVRLNNCREGEIWLKSNPTKSAVFNFTVDEEANRLVNNEKDSACDIGLRRDRVLTTVYVTPMNVCSMLPPDQAEARFLRGNFKMGNTAIPSMNTTMSQGVINSLKLNGRSIMFKGNPALIQALISGDIDFAFFSNVKPALAAGAQCFLTTANVKRAKELGRKSLAELDKNNPWIDVGQLYIYMGVNVDMARMQKIAVDTVLTHPEIVKNLSVGYSRGGIPAGQTEDQQWQAIQNHVQRFVNQKDR